MWNLMLFYMDLLIFRTVEIHDFLLAWHRWTYADPCWARIAALVPAVFASAGAGDEVANKILHDSVEELADSVKAVVKRLGLCGKG